MSGLSAANKSPSSSAPLAVSEALRTGTYVVIAAFNEGRAIAEVVAGVRLHFPNVVVVDDGSADATGAQARSAGAIVLTHFVNRGQGAALQTGIAYAIQQSARFVVTFDADGQHDVHDLPALLTPIERGEVDICLGSRFLEHKASVPPLRRLLLSAAVIFTRITSRVKLTDAHNGLRAFSHRAAAHLDLKLDRMAHASELIDQVQTSGLAYREIPVHIRYTDYSMAKGQRGSAALRVAFDYLLGRVFR
jgi:glycosyltransferase involved in cell wall biosynthesis